jgi:hypothetical protein
MIRMLAPQGGDDRELKIVSILGMGGIGKTTLARAVYKSMEGQFECSAFVSVSRNPDRRKVLEDILLELDEAEYCKSVIAEPMNEKQLIDKITGFLQNKRYARITRPLILGGKSKLVWPCPDNHYTIFCPIYTHNTVKWSNFVLNKILYFSTHMWSSMVRYWGMIMWTS